MMKITYTIPVTLQVSGEDLTVHFYQLSKNKIATVRHAIVLEGIASSVSVWEATPTTLHLHGFNTYSYTESETIELFNELFGTYLPKDRFEITMK